MDTLWFCMVFAIAYDVSYNVSTRYQILYWYYFIIILAYHDGKIQALWCYEFVRYQCRMVPIMSLWYSHSCTKEFAEEIIGHHKKGCLLS